METGADQVHAELQGASILDRKAFAGLLAAGERGAILRRGSDGEVAARLGHTATQGGEILPGRLDPIIKVVQNAPVDAQGRGSQEDNRTNRLKG